MHPNRGTVTVLLLKIIIFWNFKLVVVVIPQLNEGRAVILSRQGNEEIMSSKVQRTFFTSPTLF